MSGSIKKLEGHEPVLVYAHGHAFVFGFGVASAAGGHCITCNDTFPDTGTVVEGPDEGGRRRLMLAFRECPHPTPLPSCEEQRSDAVLDEIVKRTRDEGEPYRVFPKHEGPAHRCARRAEAGLMGTSPLVLDEPGECDGWKTRGGARCCTYCGSMDPDEFLRRVKAGATVGPTDKNYKAYLTDAEVPHGKFYFQHFSAQQRHEFIDMVNAKVVRLDYPGRFYVLPFFMRVADEGS